MAPLGVMSPRAGERWWEVEVVRVRKRVEGVEEVVRRRRVSMMYELACEIVTVAVAIEKLSL